MEGPYDLNRGPIELSQDRGNLAAGGLGSVIFVALGFWLISGDALGALARFACWLSIVGFGAMVFWCALHMARPSRLSIGPGGLTLNGVFGVRHWPWNDLEDLQLVKARGSSSITMSSKTAPSLLGFAYPLMRLPGNAGLPGAWPISTDSLFALITEAKARWG